MELLESQEAVEGYHRMTTVTAALRDALPLAIGTDGLVPPPSPAGPGPGPGQAVGGDAVQRAATARSACVWFKEVSFVVCACVRLCLCASVCGCVFVCVVLQNPAHAHTRAQRTSHVVAFQ